jgi:hypothetical protein
MNPPIDHPSTLTRSELQRLDHPGGVGRELVDIEWRSIVRGSAHAAVVEQD